MRRSYWVSRLSVLITTFVVSLPALAVTDTAILTPATFVYQSSDPTCPLGLGLYGYNANTSTGSYTPAGLTGGQTVRQLAEINTCGFGHAQLIVGGFVADPGISWLSFVYCGSASPLTGASAGYTYDSSTGEALWAWTSSPLGGASSTTCTIVHN